MQITRQKQSLMNEVCVKSLICVRFLSADVESHLIEKLIISLFKKATPRQGRSPRLC